jgi:hypothetical protein
MACAGARSDCEDGTVTLRCAPATESAVFRNGPRAGVAPRLPAVRCPVTVAVGGRELRDGPGSVAAGVAAGVANGKLETCALLPCMPPQRGRRIARLTRAPLPRCCGARHEALGHFGPLEAPELIADCALAAFGPLLPAAPVARL